MSEFKIFFLKSKDYKRSSMILNKIIKKQQNDICNQFGQLRFSHRTCPTETLEIHTVSCCELKLFKKFAIYLYCILK